MLARLLIQTLKRLGCSVLRHKKGLTKASLVVVALMLISLGVGKTYQNWDDHPSRGAVEITNGAFSESYSTPVYLDQGWSESDSLWFYNVTQGSNLLPYDLFLNIELKDSETLLRSNSVIDEYRYLPQQESFFNPDALPVGFVKDTYQDKDYIGLTCAACHTSQVNVGGKAIRIDGGPAMANMVGFLSVLQKGMEDTLEDEAKFDRFTKRVIDLGNDYSKPKQVRKDLEKWTSTLTQYNVVNHSKVKYGYARLDAFGRIYNRVLKHVQNRDQLFDLLTQITKVNGEYLLKTEEVTKILEGINKTIISDDEFNLIVERLRSNEEGYPGLSFSNLMRVRNAIFNEPNAPVSYPFLWDIAQSDYVQWNGIASNGGVGPLGRNTGEVIGVFASLDWSANEPWFSISAKLSGQDRKKKKVEFKSSVDLTNLKRLESHLKSLKSPLWQDGVDAGILEPIDEDMAVEGRKIYGRYCQSCHEFIDRNDWDRIVVGQFSALENIQTDPAMAVNSVTYKGRSGNFEDVYQGTEVGDVVIQELAPVAQILTAVTAGVVATPDADKWFVRRWLDWLYTLASSFFDNDIKSSVKAGDYNPDTTAQPYASLVSYKARSLNGIWATAPYLHNGSVPTLYDLLLPKKRAGDPEEGEYRPDRFMVGSRQLLQDKVGFAYSGYEGFEFVTVDGQGKDIRGNSNGGHEYAAGKTAQPNGEILPPLTREQRWQLLEFLKTL